MSLLDQIITCFSKQYCKIKKLECVGRDEDAKRERLLLKKLYIAYWLMCGNDDCDIRCFIYKNCNC